jgi:hypothetical protein
MRLLIAMVATANKIATIYYKMVKYKQEFNPLYFQTVKVSLANPVECLRAD